MMKFLRAILANLATLLLSLVLAIIIWFNAVQEEDPLRSQFMQIPVQLTGRPDNSILITPSNTRQTIQIGFQASASVVDAITADDFSATVDLSSVPFGQETMVPINLQARAENVEILFLSSEQMNILLEQQLARDIPVELDLRINLALGYRSGEPLIDPEFITVEGAASQVEPLETARVTVFLNNVRETVQRSPQPIFYNRQGRPASVSGLILSTEQVQVTIPVEESDGFAQKTVEASLTGEPAPGYRVVNVEVEPPTVLVRGFPTRLDDIEVVETEPVDVTGLTESFRPQVALVLPEGIAQAEGEEIFVNVTIEPFRTTSIYNQIPILQGLGDELEAELETETVRVVLFGPLPALNALLDEDVTVVVDLFGLDVGTYNLEPDVIFPEQRGIELRSLQPAQVTVNITRPIVLTDTLPLTGTGSVTNTTPVTATSRLPGVQTAVAHAPPASHYAAFTAVLQSAAACLPGNSNELDATTWSPGGTITAAAFVPRPLCFLMLIS